MLCLRVFKNLAQKLRDAQGDPFILRSLIGDGRRRKNKHPCDLDSDDETEFFEVLVNNKSTFIDVSGLALELEIDKRQSLCLNAH
jgi:hypothetical protein